jgi:hypothetical protein
MRWRLRLARKNHLEHARVTAICVNLALDAVEADLSAELHRAKGEAAFALERVLARLRTRRVDRNEYETAGTC